MGNRECMLIERYRLVLTHDLIQGSDVIRLDDPIVFEIHNCDCDNFVVGYKDYLIDQLFNRFREQLKEQNNGEKE